MAILNDEVLLNWYPLRVESGFLSTVGPIYWREVDDILQMRFRVEPRHCNPIGSCHGGMLATFADIVLGFGVGHRAGKGAFMPTIGLTCDFLAPAPLGSWVASHAEVMRCGKSIGVARCVITTDIGESVAQASGIFKVDRPLRSDFSHSDFLSRDT